MTATARVLDRLAAPLRTWPAVAVLAASGTVALATLGVAAWSARLGWVEGGLWVAAAWGGVVVALGLGGWRARAVRRRATASGVARTLEGEGVWRRGALTGVLAEPIPGTSDALFAAADAAQAEGVARTAPLVLAPVV
ncbi:MAG TPA: hypothetical protein VG712_05085, partial [Gemmatimonadales bacterium]|nr:hypothetical protein [Gemmatimonadales bacterium]